MSVTPAGHTKLKERKIGDTQLIERWDSACGMAILMVVLIIN